MSILNHSGARYIVGGADRGLTTCYRHTRDGVACGKSRVRIATVGQRCAVVNLSVAVSCDGQRFLRYGQLAILSQHIRIVACILNGVEVCVVVVSRLTYIGNAGGIADSQRVASRQSEDLASGIQSSHCRSVIGHRVGFLGMGKTVIFPSVSTGFYDNR